MCNCIPNRLAQLIVCNVKFAEAPVMIRDFLRFSIVLPRRFRVTVDHGVSGQVVCVSPQVITEDLVISGQRIKNVLIREVLPQISNLVLL